MSGRRRIAGPVTVSWVNWGLALVDWAVSAALVLFFVVAFVYLLRAASDGL